MISISLSMYIQVQEVRLTAAASTIKTVQILALIVLLLFCWERAEPVLLRHAGPTCC